MGKQKRFFASYTVEATFIVPIVTMIVVLLISETLFYRDILTAERVAMSAAENGLRYSLNDASLGKADWDYSHLTEAGVGRTLLRYNTNKDKYKIEEYASKKLEESLWFAVAGPVTTEIDGDEVRVSFMLLAQDDILAVFRPLNIGLFHRNISVTEYGHDAPGTNRLLIAAWETGEKTKGVSEFLGKIETLMEKVFK